MRTYSLCDYPLLAPPPGDGADRATYETLSGARSFILGMVNGGVRDRYGSRVRTRAESFADVAHELAKNAWDACAERAAREGRPIEGRLLCAHGPDDLTFCTYDRGAGVPEAFRAVPLGRTEIQSAKPALPWELQRLVVGGEGQGLRMVEQTAHELRGEWGYASPLTPDGGSVFWLTVPYASLVRR
jgi:hypothetical protein